MSRRVKVTTNPKSVELIMRSVESLGTARDKLSKAGAPTLANDVYKVLKRVTAVLSYTEFHS